MLSDGKQTHSEVTLIFFDVILLTIPQPLHDRWDISLWRGSIAHDVKASSGHSWNLSHSTMNNAEELENLWSKLTWGDLCHSNQYQPKQDLEEKISQVNWHTIAESCLIPWSLIVKDMWGGGMTSRFNWKFRSKFFGSWISAKDRAEDSIETIK